MSATLRLVVDVVIVITLVEFVVLAAWHRRTGRGVNPAGILRHLLSGLMLMLALRAAITSASPWLVMAFLALAGLAHALDIWNRWQR